MFYVIAAGVPSPSYQWLSNGVPMPGQTAPILLVENVITNIPRSYSVVVSNSGAGVESAPATLSVTAADPVPYLGALPPTNGSQVPFTLRGEAGRWYQFQITDDLVNWFDYGFGLSTNVTSSFSTLRFDQNMEFVRALLNFQTDTCVAQLKAVRAAQDLFAIEHKLKTTAYYTFFDIQPYFAGGNLPVCPQRGTYATGATITNNPACSLQSICGHTIGN
jgi:hypothetical protein